MYPGNGNRFLCSSIVPAIMALSLEILGGKCDTWIRQPFATLSHCPCGSLRCPFHHVFSDAGSRKNQVRAWIVSQMLPLLCHCANKFLHSAHSVMSEFVSWCQVWRHLVIRAKWIAPLGLPTSVFNKSVFVPYVLQCCGPIVGWIWIWDSNTMEHLRTRELSSWSMLVLDHSAQRISWPTKCAPILQDLHVVCVFAIDQYVYLSLHGLCQILCSWETFVHPW